MKVSKRARGCGVPVGLVSFVTHALLTDLACDLPLRAVERREHECTNENESDDYTARHEDCAAAASQRFAKAADVEALSERSAAIPPFGLRSALLARLLVGAV